MIPRDVKSPTRAIPFHKLLKVVAIIDRDNEETKQLVDHIAAENFQIETRIASPTLQPWRQPVR
jgi:ornithine decarboxylase